MDDALTLPLDQATAAEPLCRYCLTDLTLGDHAHEADVDVRQVQTTLEAVARGEGPLVSLDSLVTAR